MKTYYSIMNPANNFKQVLCRTRGLNIYIKKCWPEVTTDPNMVSRLFFALLVLSVVLEFSSRCEAQNGKYICMFMTCKREVCHMTKVEFLRLFLTVVDA